MIMDLYCIETLYGVYVCVNCVCINGLDGVELVLSFRLLIKFRYIYKKIIVFIQQINKYINYYVYSWPYCYFWFLGNYYLSYFMINESQESAHRKVLLYTCSVSFVFDLYQSCRFVHFLYLFSLFICL